ncbi:MAG: biopolymer transporter ExbD [Bacteroidia bacterium]|jgi:biopolymer transport protein ExbD|nr:biopolymer transporter ExbD [Bacteroidia bacterium]
MKLRRKKRFEAEVATSSLNDIMFFLLLFFLIISTIANPNVIKVLLPKADKSQTLNKKQYALSVNENKEYYFEKEFISDPSTLEQVLKTKTAGVEDPTIVLRMDAKLNIQDLVDILSIGTRLKIRIVMATQVGK